MILTLCAICFKNIAQVTIASSNVQKAKCYGICDGKITFSISGATGPFSVAITNTAGCSNPTVAAFPGPTVSINNVCPCNSWMTQFSFYDGSSTFIGNSYAGFGIPATAPLTVTTNIIPATCATCCTGSVYCIANGGSTTSGPTTFSIDGVYLASMFWPAWNVCPGTHTLCGRDNEGCVVCVTFTMGFSTGIESQTSFLKQGVIAPNPSSDKFIYSGVVIELGSEFVLTTITGQEVLRKKVEVETELIEFDVSNLPSGMFFLHHSFKNKKTTVKILVD